MYGHIKVELGIAFSKAPFPFSDGAKLIGGYGKEQLIKSGWQSLFEPDSVREQTEMIVKGEVKS